MKQDTALSWSFLVYALAWHLSVFGGCAYVVFGLNQSGWWFALAFVIASCSYSPDRWADLWRPDRRSSED